MTPPGPKTRQDMLVIGACEAAARVLWPALREDPDPSCIAYTLMARTMLDQVGYASVPVKVRARVANKRAAENIASGKQWPPPVNDGSYVMFVGGTGLQQPDRWDGHLVLLVEGRALLDLTIQQASRPEKQLRLRPVVAWAGDNLDKHGGICTVSRMDGIIIEYERDESLADWSKMPAATILWNEVYRQRSG